MFKPRKTKFYQRRGFYLSCLLALFAVVSILSIQKTMEEKPDQHKKTELAQNNETTAHTYDAVKKEYGNIDFSPEGDTPHLQPKSDAAVQLEEATTTLLPEENSSTLSQEKEENHPQSAADSSSPVDNPSTPQKKISTENNAAEIAVLKTEDQGQGLPWPLKGEVILPYSMDKPVFFQTLNQYKCNPAIFIQGKEGTAITSVCDATITKVKRTEDLGLTIEAQSGDYTYIYGQLSNPKVAKGDTIQAGTVIASLSVPSKYYKKEGTHLYFQVKDGDQPVDPLLLLQ